VRGKYLGTNEEEMAELVRAIRRLLHPKESPSADASPPVQPELSVNVWYRNLPAVNAGLNGLATVLLAAGFLLIKGGRMTAHRNVMLTAFAVSIAFLGCYLVYHWALHAETGLPGKKFEGEGLVRPVYFSILISHVILAAAVPVLALITIYYGLKGDWARHRRIAKITFPIWMYVSVTGVIIYVMLYHWPTET
jgi:protein SCO1/2